MGAGVFHGRVRDGIGCRHPAKATRSSNPESFPPGLCPRGGFGVTVVCVGCLFVAVADGLVRFDLCGIDLMRRCAAVS